MSHQAFAWSPGIEAQPRPVASESDPDLALMLAQQAINRLQFELRSLSDPGTANRDPEFARYEASIAIGAVEALANRMRPFASFIDRATRFEAQEILAALDGIRTELERIVQPREREKADDAADVAARLLARRA